jgi:uncharacterized protein
MASAAPSTSTDIHSGLDPSLIAKENELRRMMRSMEKVLVAYSGGVDSAYLAFIANQELGDNAISITGISPSVSATQRLEAKRFADIHKLQYREIETEELADQNYAANPANRCYFCKSELFGKLRTIAKDEGLKFILDGTNADDLRDVRPGRVAANENGVRSPLAEIGISKSEIRELSRSHHLETWEKPSSPCLSSRVAYGITVTRERLSQIEQAEDALHELGFREFRVRSHGEIARIEISQAEIDNFLDKSLFTKVSVSLKSFGFKFVTLDLDGYRQGSMNQ